jgi:isopenicillin-N epimerase
VSGVDRIAPPSEIRPPAPLRPNLRSQWRLHPDVAFLNHGSFGATPRIVLEEQTRWRERIEAEPVELIGRQRPELIAAAKEPLGRWLGMRQEDFGFVTNATDGINAVLRSLDFRPGDELLTTDHVYNAVRHSMRNVAARSGAVYRELSIPLPLSGPDEIVQRIALALTPATRLLIVDHVTSPTAIVFPVERIVTACAARGVDVLIDGAHAPGMLPGLNVPGLGAAWYAANLHKWVCAPKGCAFLWARADRQAGLHPLVVSHFFGQGLAKEFEWQGTRDISAWLCVPAALRFMEELGWERVIAHNHAMAVWAQRMLCERWGVEPITPITGQMLGSMASLPLPLPFGPLNEHQCKPIQQQLYERYKVEAPIMTWPGRPLIRPCAQVYTAPSDFHRLADAISDLAQENCR